MFCMAGKRVSWVVGSFPFSMLIRDTDEVRELEREWAVTHIGNCCQVAFPEIAFLDNTQNEAASAANSR